MIVTFWDFAPLIKSINQVYLYGTLQPDSSSKCLLVFFIYVQLSTMYHLLHSILLYFPVERAVDYIKVKS